MGKKKRRHVKRESSKSKEHAERHEHVNKERILAAERRKRKQLLTWSFIIIALCFVSLLIYGLMPKPSPFVDFATCLAEADAKMYGTDSCAHCQVQKRMFGTAFKYVDYENCDYSRVCQEEGITAYPTWVINEERLVGQQPLELLAEKTGCILPGETQ
ncbi:hypothetical protein GOV07_04970 [Candidatus Woesearchaeota archaeon]|nr:hypothetical protein [Candidatus Woesearchaeota archaeon]